MGDESAVPGVGERDLAAVLKRLMSRHGSTRKSADSRRRLANDVLTRAYLEAGLRLITDELRPGEAEGDASGEEEFDDRSRPFFDWLSQSKVIEEVAHGDEGLRGSAGTLRDRWPFRSDFIEDLLTYSLWVRHWGPHMETAMGGIEPLVNAPDFVEAVHTLAYLDLKLLADSPTYRLSLIASATADRDPTARAAMGEMYRLLHQTWRELYTRTLEAHDMKLRPGFTADDLAMLLTAMAEGLRLRMTADPDAEIVDDERRRSLLGLGALGLLAGTVDSGDGRTVEEIVADLADPPG